MDDYKIFRYFNGNTSKLTIACQQTIIDCAQGNPGALTFLCKLFDSDISTNDEMAEQMHVLRNAQDTGIAGSNLYILWNDMFFQDTWGAYFALKYINLQLIKDTINSFSEGVRAIPCNYRSSELHIAGLVSHDDPRWIRYSKRSMEVGFKDKNQLQKEFYDARVKFRMVNQHPRNPLMSKKEIADIQFDFYTSKALLDRVDYNELARMMHKSMLVMNKTMRDHYYMHLIDEILYD